MRRAELREILDQYGVVTPLAVVEKARHGRSALHDIFEWDDTKAAHQHRLTQARHAIRQYKFVIEASDCAPVRALVMVNSRKRPQPGASEYRSITDVLNDDDERAELLAQALSELRKFQRKYAALKEAVELRGVFNAMGEVPGIDDRD